MEHVARFLKKEAAFTVSFLLAGISCIIVPPSAAYWGYIDFKVLSCLFCLMLIVGGVSRTGFFSAAAIWLIKRTGSTRRLAAAVVALCFFSSMFVTNDVALITFVPFTLTVLTICDKTWLAIPVVVLQTIAANLGSALTPIGNPQNLYLYSFYDMSIETFFGAMLPIVGGSALLLLLCLLPIKRRPIDMSAIGNAHISSPKPLFTYFWLFVLCLFAVFGLVDYRIVLGAVVILILALDPKMLLKLDYSLLATFVCFFILVGNLSHMEAVSNLLSGLVKDREVLVGALSSQFISNVPAAVLLSGFTDNAAALLRGVNVGGCGTLIASMASLISFRAYSAMPDAKRSRYVLLFTAVNVVYLVILYAVAVLV